MAIGKQVISLVTTAVKPFIMNVAAPEFIRMFTKEAKLPSGSNRFIAEHQLDVAIWKSTTKKGKSADGGGDGSDAAANDGDGEQEDDEGDEGIDVAGASMADRTHESSSSSSSSSSAQAVEDDDADEAADAEEPPADWTWRFKEAFLFFGHLALLFGWHMSERLMAEINTTTVTHGACI